MSQNLMRAGAVAATLALFAAFAPAKAAPLLPAHGLASAPSTVESARYRRHYSYQPSTFYLQDDYGSGYYGNRGSDEIRELQRLYPETNWPRSMRYFDY